MFVGTLILGFSHEVKTYSAQADEQFFSCFQYASVICWCAYQHIPAEKVFVLMPLYYSRFSTQMVITKPLIFGFGAIQTRRKCLNNRKIFYKKKQFV
jgi:hypothetical protein